MVRVAFGNTYDIQDYAVAEISDEEFLRLEELRGGRHSVVISERESGVLETYLGPV